MPIYEYQCPQCQNVFEEWLKASEMTDTYACPQCGGEARHIMSHTSFVLKGGGWYVDDYGYRKGLTGEDAAPKANSADAANAPVEDAAPAAAPAAESTPAAAPATAAPAANGTQGSKVSSGKASAQAASGKKAPAAASGKTAPAA